MNDISNIIDNFIPQTKTQCVFFKRARDINMKNFVAPESPITPQEARDILHKGNPNAGIKGTVEVVDNEVISSNGKCVFYDGWSAAGLKSSEIEQLCRGRFEIYIGRIWKKRNPNIEGELRKFKESSEGLCLEVLKFKEYPNP